VDPYLRIAELEAELASKDARIAAQGVRIAEQDAQLAGQSARIAAQDARIAELEQKVATLLEKLNRNSGNSSLPPSSDPPGSRGGSKSKPTKGKRRRGGQAGHRGSHRSLLPADRVDDIINFFPAQCEHCCERLPQTPDPLARRYQSTELPAFEPHTTEYRRHTVACPRCKATTCAPYDPDKIPSSPFGPRLMSAVALLTGVYHLSRRRTVQLLSDLVGVKISLGAVSAVEARVSEAVLPAVEEANERVVGAAVKHTDGTGWLQTGKMLSLWTIATACATVFKIVANGRADTLRPLYGKLRGILVSDRATALNFWAMERRQICWAHLLRKFVSFEERDGPTGDFGRELLELTGIIFAYWHDYRDRHLKRDVLVTWMVPVRAQFEALLERAVAAKIDGLSGSCADMLAHRLALWTFVERDGVEPTNNHAERELRAFVLWRKRSFGTQSERGNRFAERLMTIAHTARKQSKNVLELLTACCVAHLDGGSAPSLFETERSAA
jgi:transposase